METKTITEEFVRRCDDEMRYHSSLYQKDGDPFAAQTLSSMAGCAFPAVDLWHGLWYQGEIACLFGEPNVGKTILAMQIANNVNKRGLNVYYYDFENAAHQFKPRYRTEKFDYKTGDGEFVVKSLNPNYSNAKLDSRSILDYIKKDIINDRAAVIIIDDITHLIGSGDQADVRYVLNTLRSWTQHFLVSILVLAHSRRLRFGELTTIDSLAGSFEFTYSFDSIFSLSKANRYNAENNDITHYIKHHKNRMGPVVYNDMNVITARFGRDEGNGFLQLNDLTTGGNERQLLRDNGYNSFNEINKAILQYKQLHFSTREIARIIGCSQSHVSRTIRKHEAMLEKKQLEAESTESGESFSANDPIRDNSCKLVVGELPESAESIRNNNLISSNSLNSCALTEPISVNPCKFVVSYPRIRLETDLTPIYDESKYRIDPYGMHITIEEYNKYYGDDEIDDDYDYSTGDNEDFT